MKTPSLVLLQAAVSCFYFASGEVSFLPCGQSIVVGQPSMRSSSPDQQDNGISVSFVVNGQNVGCGSTASGDDTIQIQESNSEDHKIIEVLGDAAFANGGNVAGCTVKQKLYDDGSNRLSYNLADTELVIFGEGTITAYGAGASRFGAVGRSSDCTLQIQGGTFAPAPAGSGATYTFQLAAFSNSLNEADALPVLAEDTIIFEGTQNGLEIYTFSDKQALESCDFGSAQEIPASNGAYEFEVSEVTASSEGYIYVVAINGNQLANCASAAEYFVLSLQDSAAGSGGNFEVTGETLLFANVAISFAVGGVLTAYSSVFHK